MHIHIHMYVCIYVCVVGWLGRKWRKKEESFDFGLPLIIYYFSKSLGAYLGSEDV